MITLIKPNAKVFRQLTLPLRHLSSVDKIVQDGVLLSVPMAFTSIESTSPANTSTKCPIIIMHGLLGSKGHWNAITKAVHATTQRKVFAVDARNHGDSEHSTAMTCLHLVEDALRFASDNDVEKAVYVGHDMGGLALMSLALKHPRTVDRLVLVDTSPVSPATFGMSLMQRSLAAMEQVTLEANITLSAARRSVNEQLRVRIPQQELRRILLTNLVSAENCRYKWRTNVAAISKHYSSLTTMPRFPASALFTRPTLFITGGASDGLRRTDFTDVRRLFPRAKFEIIRGAGHWLHLQKPAEFVDILTDFIDAKIPAEATM